MNYTSETYGYFNSSNQMSNIVITEMLSSSNQAEQQQEEATSMAEYVVEEPYDYIFEPNHYPKPSMDQPHEQVNHQHRRLIEEKDGILIYEQCSSTDRFENSSSVYQHHHLNALIRNISEQKRCRFCICKPNHARFACGVLPTNWLVDLDFGCMNVLIREFFTFVFKVMLSSK